MGDKHADRRTRAIDRLLADPRWADHWVGYWQDVLAENPGILKPSSTTPARFATGFTRRSSTTSRSTVSPPNSP